MPRFLPIGKEARGAAGFLLAALPALGALLTALAISGDLIGRMARNHPGASFGAFGSAALAVFLGAVLRSSDHLVVEVEQLVRVSDHGGHPSCQPGQPLY